MKTTLIALVSLCAGAAITGALTLFGLIGAAKSGVSVEIALTKADVATISQELQTPGADGRPLTDTRTTVRCEAAKELCHLHVQMAPTPQPR